MRAAWVAPILLLVSAAAPAKEYVAPTAPPLATLTVHNRTPSPLVPATFTKPAKCTGMLSLMPRKKGLVMAELAPDQSVTVTIDAGREFTLYAEVLGVTSAGATSCRMIWTFKPEEGRRYLATALAEGSSCALPLEREVAAPDGTGSREKEPSARRREVPDLVFGWYTAQCKAEIPVK